MKLRIELAYKQNTLKKLRNYTGHKQGQIMCTYYLSLWPLTQRVVGQSRGSHLVIFSKSMCKITFETTSFTGKENISREAAQT